MTNNNPKAELAALAMRLKKEIDDDKFVAKYVLAMMVYTYKITSQEADELTEKCFKPGILMRAEKYNEVATILNNI